MSCKALRLKDPKARKGHEARNLANSYNDVIEFKTQNKQEIKKTWRGEKSSFPKEQLENENLLLNKIMNTCE